MSGRRTRTEAAGFTLIELLVAVAVGGIITVTMFAFGAQQIKSRAVTELRLETEQNGRVAMDSMRRDLQMAGLGTGYGPDGRFLGLVLGTFGPFESNDHDHGGNDFTDDLRIRGAEGPVRTIIEDLDPSDGAVEVCSSDGAFEVGRLALLVDENFFHGRAVEITGVAAQTCAGGTCEGTGNACERVSFVDRSPVYSTDPGASVASYAGGSLFHDYHDVVYFVDKTGTVPLLYRAAWPCGPGPTPASRGACATPQNLLAEGVESLQLRVLELTAPGTFTDVTGDAGYLSAGGVTTENRLRVELELVTRSRMEKENASPNRTCSRIRPASCYPDVDRDRFTRQLLHGAVELKNSGMMRFTASR